MKLHRQSPSTPLVQPSSAQQGGAASRSNSDAIARMTTSMAGEAVAEATNENSCVAEPFLDGATRQDFVWALAQANPELALGYAPRESVLAAAKSAGITDGARPEDPINRAEAAAIVVRALELGDDLPERKTAYFYDVNDSQWYFRTAHVARRHGIFKGGDTDNLFRPDTALSVAEAKIVIARSEDPGVIEPEEQCPGTSPMLEPDAALGLLRNDELSADEIALVRESIARLPEDQRAELYRQVASKVTYRSQRDNAGGGGWSGDEMCQLTSLAMAMNQLGVGADESEAQFEDQLNSERIEKGLGGLTDQSTRTKLAEEHGLSCEKLWPRRDSSGATAYSSIEEWFLEEIGPRLEAGAAAMMGISYGEYGHVVRLEWVESDGVLVDDPFGRNVAGAYSSASGGGLNATTSSEGDGALGEDNKWDWETVSKRVGYVQVVGSGSAAVA